MKQFTQNLTVMGRVSASDPDSGMFRIKCRSGDEFDAYVTTQTSFNVLQNLDSLDNDRVPNPDGFDPSKPSWLIKKYISVGLLIAVEGIHQVNRADERFDARTVHLLVFCKRRSLSI